MNNRDLASERRTRHCRKPQRCVYYATNSSEGYNGTCDYILITGTVGLVGSGMPARSKRRKAGRCAAAG